MHGFPHFPVLAAAAEGSAPDVTRLVTVLILAIVLILVLILKFRIQAFVSLLVAAIFVGIASGTMSLVEVGDTIVSGMGSSLGFIATIIGLGAIFGQMIEHSGGAQSLANGLLKAMVFGFLVTMTNPKAVVLFTSVFATAVSQTTPLWLMGTMIALVFASSLVWYSIVSLFMSSRPVIRRFGHARSWIEKAAGVCFVGIGGRILADARNPVSP